MTKNRSDLERVLSKLDTSGDCWIWTGVLRADGYASTHTGSRAAGDFQRHKLVHRLVYEHLVSPIPEGMVIDHLCRTPACSNPAHLEAVTQAENLRRAAHHYRSITHCKQGHSLDDAYRNKRGWRRCRPCTDKSNRAGDRRRRAARKQAA